MIKVENLKIGFGKHRVLNGIDLQIERNETLALIGPSGCGKTTLLRVIAGFEVPDEGNISIDDRMVSQPGFAVPPNKRNVSLIFQDLALWPHMTIKEHLSFVLNGNKFEKAFMAKRIKNLLDSVNLSQCSNRLPHQLSGGEQQRLAIVRGIAQSPHYLLMDEPFSNLDPILKKKQEQVLNGLKKKHMIGIIYVSHNIEEVNNIADRIAVMNKGGIVQVDIKEKIFQNPANQFVKDFLNC